jgi:hypothetical protein
MDGTYQPPVGDGSGTDRKSLRKAFELLGEAGYERRGAELVNVETGEPLAFEILVRTQEEESLALAFQRTCALVGARANVRRVEAQQYELRIKSFDFDMIRFTYPSSLSPGNEQTNRWSSTAGRKSGLVQLRRCAQPRRGRDDRRPACGERTRRIRGGCAGAGPGADLRLLPGAVVPHARGVVGAVGAHRAPGKSVPLWRRTDDLVGEAMSAPETRVTCWP